jgi:uncharacterized protein HemY
MQAAGNQSGEALLTYNLGRIALYRGDYKSAEKCFSSSLDISKTIGDFRVLAYAFLGMGLVAIGQDQFETARGFLSQSLVTSQELGDLGMLVWIMEAFGTIQQRTNQAESAVRLYASASALRAEINLPVPQSNLAEYRQTLDILQDILTKERFEVVWEAGQLIPAAQAVKEAV